MKTTTNRVKLTAGRVESFACPSDKSQAFLWDTETPTLALRATPSGRKTYVFESRLNGSTIRLTIGTAADWPIKKAQGEAQRLKMMIDAGTDPREVERQQQAAKVATQAAATAHALTVGEVWALYLDAREPKWGVLHMECHTRLSSAGGSVTRRGTRGHGVTMPGPLHPLMALPLRDLDNATVEAWAAVEAKTRPTVARLAWRLLKAFLNWCAEQPEYAGLLPAKNPAKTTKTREALGKAKVKQDALLREQLPVWFDAVRKINNPVVAAYLQTLLLTGARPGEVLTLRWEDVNLQWRGLTIRDKVDGTRIIPLTPYVAQLLTAQKRRNEWVFSSPDGLLGRQNRLHSGACKVAGIDNLTLHGLRRSFKSLTEWLEIPAGVVAQLMGHKPSATAEKHYTVRPLDLLRVHHEKIEAWILEQAGITFDANAGAGGLRVVTNTQ